MLIAIAGFVGFVIASHKKVVAVTANPLGTAQASSGPLPGAGPTPVNLGGPIVFMPDSVLPNGPPVYSNVVTNASGPGIASAAGQAKIRAPLGIAYKAPSGPGVNDNGGIPPEWTLY